MRTRALALGLLCALPLGCVSRPTTAEAAKHQERDDWTSPDADDGDLPPTTPDSACQGYELEVHERLLGNVDESISMLCIPSFSPEYAVALVQVPMEGAPRRRSSPAAGTEFEWTLVIIQAESSIWRIWPQDSEPPPSTQDIAERIPVKRTENPLDTDTATACFEAWEQVVSRTRYPRPAIETYPNGEREFRPPDSGCDGETYNFRALGHFGEAWYPRRGLAGDLVRLANHLVELSGLEGAARLGELGKCRTQARELFEAAQSEPW